jgi:hypothetical protein
LRYGRGALNQRGREEICIVLMYEETLSAFPD